MTAHAHTCAETGTFAYTKWIIKHTSASVFICVVHANTSLDGKIEAPVMQVYGASFMTAAGDVFLLSGTHCSHRRTQMNRHTCSPLWRYLQDDASSPCLCYGSQSCITTLCLLTSLSWAQKWVNLCSLPPKAPLHLPVKTRRCAQKSWRIFDTCCPAVIKQLCITHAPLHTAGIDVLQLGKAGQECNFQVELPLKSWELAEKLFTPVPCLLLLSQWEEGKE